MSMSENLRLYNLVILFRGARSPAIVLHGTSANTWRCRVSRVWERRGTRIYY
jgi:hypothetical protein